MRRFVVFTWGAEGLGDAINLHLHLHLHLHLPLLYPVYCLTTSTWWHVVSDGRAWGTSKLHEAHYSKPWLFGGEAMGQGWHPGGLFLRRHRFAVYQL
jgi:hypothetical protein